MSQEKEMTYEQAVGRLEEIAGLMESGKLSLDESMKLYDESVRLTEFCYSKLEAFKQRVYEVTSSVEKEIAQND